MESEEEPLDMFWPQSVNAPSVYCASQVVIHLLIHVLQLIVIAKTQSVNTKQQLTTLSDQESHNRVCWLVLS